MNRDRAAAIKEAVYAGLVKADGGMDDMAEEITTHLLAFFASEQLEISEEEATLLLARALGVRIKRGTIESYPSQENVDVREEDGHLYLHVRSTQPAGLVALRIYEQLLRAVQQGYEPEIHPAAAPPIRTLGTRGVGPL